VAPLLFDFSDLLEYKKRKQKKLVKMKVGEWWASQLRNLDEPPPTPLPPRRPKPKAVPRRTKSMPSAPKYMMPTENMGEYDSGAQRRKSAPAKQGGLYPLDEEGTYGRPPAAPAPPPPKKERKPKVYASYAVESSCDIHAKKLEKLEKQREKELEEQRSRRRRNSFRRNVSASPSRASSEARTSRSSKSPDPHQQNGYVRRKSSIGSADGRKSSGSGGYSGQTTSMRYSSSSSSHKISGGIREERGEYSYSENRKSSGYSKYANDGGITNGVSGMSLDGLRKPKIDSWDSMGILGLSSKMWSTTSKQQETFMSSTGQFLREENSTYIM